MLLSTLKSDFLTSSCQNYYKVKKLFFLSSKLLLLRLCLSQSKPKFFGSLKMVKWTQGPSHSATRDDNSPCTVAHCARPRTEANCRCDVSFERALITSRPRARSYASRERKLWWEKFKIKRFASGCDENWSWDSRSIEGKGKLSRNPLAAILASLDHFCGIYGASSWNGRLESPQPPHFSYC